MKDARGVPIVVGDNVTFAHHHKTTYGGFSTVGWGTVVKINEKMIRVETNDEACNKAPHNVIVAALPVI